MNATKPRAYDSTPGPPVNPPMPTGQKCERCGDVLTDEWVGQASRTMGYICGPCHRDKDRIAGVIYDYDPSADVNLVAAELNRRPATGRDAIEAFERLQEHLLDLRGSTPPPGTVVVLAQEVMATEAEVRAAFPLPHDPHASVIRETGGDS